MTARQFWLGSRGPFRFDDANTFTGGRTHGLQTDKTPTEDEDVVRKIDLADYAPAGAQYLVLANDAALTAERRFVPGAGIASVDGGANGDYTISLDIAELTAVAIAAGDFLAFADVTDFNLPKKITFANLEAALNHDSLLGFVADEHVAHSGVTLTAGVGLTGGGTIAANRTFDLDISELTADTAVGATDVLAIHDGAMKKLTLANFELSLFKSQGIQITGGINPSSGLGLELEYDSVTGFSDILSFNRDATAYLTLRLRGLDVRLLASTTERLKVDGTGIGFFATAPAAKQTVTGSRGSNAALASLLTGLATYGLITDSSSA